MKEEKSPYEKPSITVMEIAVEEGLASSYGSPGEPGGGIYPGNPIDL